MGEQGLPRPCGESIELTAEEHAALDAVDHGAHEINWTLNCEYEVGHPGPHNGFAQCVEDPRTREIEATWWVQWSSAGRKTVRLTREFRCFAEGSHPCDAPDEEPWQCEFAADHPGVHDWQMEGFTQDYTKL